MIKWVVSPSPVLRVQSMEVNESGIVFVDESTECETISPGRGHVGDPDTRVPPHLSPAPTLQTQDSRHCSTHCSVVTSLENCDEHYKYYDWNIFTSWPWYQRTGAETTALFWYWTLETDSGSNNTIVTGALYCIISSLLTRFQGIFTLLTTTINSYLKCEAPPSNIQIMSWIDLTIDNSTDHGMNPTTSVEMISNC